MEHEKREEKHLRKDAEWSSGFPYFLQFKSEFGSNEFIDLSHSQLPVLYFC